MLRLYNRHILHRTDSVSLVFCPQQACSLVVARSNLAIPANYIVKFIWLLKGKLIDQLSLFTPWRGDVKTVTYRQKDEPMQKTDDNQRQVHLEVINLRISSCSIICCIHTNHRQLKGWIINRWYTTKISDLAKHRTITPTSFVSVIPLQKQKRLLKESFLINSREFLNFFEISGAKWPHP